jgi:hypothetical protein
MKNFLQILKEQKLARNWYWYRGMDDDYKIESKLLYKKSIKGVFLSTDIGFAGAYTLQFEDDHKPSYMYTCRLKLPLEIFNLEFPPDAKKMEEAGIEIPWRDVKRGFTSDFIETEECLQFITKAGYDGAFITEGQELNVIIFDHKNIIPLRKEKIFYDHAEMKILKKPKREPYKFAKEDKEIIKSFTDTKWTNE